MKNVLVAGAGGFIGGHLVNHLINHGANSVFAVDIKPKERWFQLNELATNVGNVDLRYTDQYGKIPDVKYDIIYNLACDMGGIGFIERNKAKCMVSVMINTILISYANMMKVDRYFYSSSACAYNINKQNSNEVIALKEEDVYPAQPEDGYGWEKLFSERMCKNFTEDYGLPTRVARLHNVYGPYGEWYGGREKSPAALCRKVAEAVIGKQSEIEIWGDGTQQRSFMWIDDCIHGIGLLMRSDYDMPLNLGSSELVTINQMLDIIEKIAGTNLKRKYVEGPIGVKGRNSDNTRIKQLFGWEPSTKLETGLEKTYKWIYQQIEREQDEN